MLTIPIQGIKDGKYEVDISTSVSAVDNIFPEFVGDINVHGLMTKIGDRITIQAEAKANANLVCDYSLQEFSEQIVAPVSMSYLLDTELFTLRSKEDGDDTYEVHVLRSDEKLINITEEVAQELSVRLPLKRIAPQYRDKNITDIVQDEHIITNEGSEAKKPDEVDERWSALKNITFNN